MTIFDQGPAEPASDAQVARLTYTRVEKPEIREENLDAETIRSMHSQAEQSPRGASDAGQSINASALLRSDKDLGVAPCDSFDGSREFPLISSQSSPVNAQALLRSDVK